MVLTVTGTTGCGAAPVSAGWTGNSARRCPDTLCLVLAAYRRDAHGDLQPAACGGLQVAAEPGGVAAVVDGELLESGGSGWLRVTAG